MDDLRRQAAAGDQMYQEAYEAGLAGDDYTSSGDPQLQDAYQAGVEEREARARGDATGGTGWGQRLADSARQVRPKAAPDWVNDGAGFLLGLVAYALTLNYLQGGAAQAKGWIAAKFINKPYGARQADVPRPRNPSYPRTPG